MGQELQCPVLRATDPATRFEGGFRVQREGVTVVNLSGTWREMGRQYGALLSKELQDVYTFAEKHIKKTGMTAVQVLLDQWAQISFTVRSFMEGMAETSGLTLAQLHRANAVERICGLPQCSAAFAWGPYAKDKLVVGRNYDYGEIFFDLRQDVVVTVYHPCDGSLATATIGYAGEIYAVNALNERGVFFELNCALPSTRMDPVSDLITGTTLLLNTMFEADSLDYLDAFFHTALCSESYIINACDSHTALSYEWCPIGMKKGGGDMPEGLLVSANLFTNPDWGFPIPTDVESWLSYTRKDALMQRCEEQKGELDAAAMRGIIQRRIREGGAANPLTVYQIVAVPETLTIWLRTIGLCDWIEIDLTGFLLP